MGDLCRKPDCSWLALPSLKDLKEPPELVPNPELSGVGVILGFSITAYLTVALLLFHYLTVYDPHRIDQVARPYTNPVDNGLLNVLRGKVTSWTPSILVYVAWFSSFTFLSAMAFLEGFFLANNSLRLIRVFFMCIMGALQIAALLPTGSRNWLDAAREAGPLYVGLSAECFYQHYSRGGPRMWSMIFSVLVVGVSYVHTGIRLFDPTAKFSRKYFRAIPGSRVYARRNHMALFRNRMGFARSMEHASTDVVTQLDDGDIVFKNTYNDDDTWSFGQILPLVLLLLPILSMFQAYLDNDAKAQDTVRKRIQTVGLAAVGSGTGMDDKQATSTRDATSGGISRCNYHQPSPDTNPSRLGGTNTTVDDYSTPSVKQTSPPDPESQHAPSVPPTTLLAPLPRHPYPHLFAYHWYRDHVYLLVCQLVMIGCVILWVQDALVSILGISYILRNRLFLIWAFGFLPLSSVVHLAVWYLAANVVRRIDGAEEWLDGTGRYGCTDGEGRRWCGGLTRGRCVYYLLVFSLKGGLLTMTLLGSAVIAGPQDIDLGNG
ncbi:hypothetical protein P171DRAFT_445743 [Karstenula rhodostoma CBS 690.94]|uniref:Uncharacterized protein n=1 Tax=Karstenula rhodostoma CBS 690.94 TaxID=1392251 RepID=A0A9P4PG25_9PLEO|nr:hypothetical protein P171DRAFT_445743 [Karstenula rhodostoma CBS 690.94]